jgi:hypothetical protein
MVRHVSELYLPAVLGVVIATLLLLGALLAQGCGRALKDDHLVTVSKRYDISDLRGSLTR